MSAAWCEDVKGWADCSASTTAMLLDFGAIEFSNTTSESAGAECSCSRRGGETLSKRRGSCYRGAVKSRADGLMFQLLVLPERLRGALRGVDSARVSESRD